ncbi:ABC transporter permease [Salinirubellus salinus]|uniref:ABC transporter permease n=1 Tax=Salinirubellus salinus TaxID=1364945 RepID=A0A9E7QZS1_9EURY|nr:ABC transporter permease [Salinirubellus salinus]UWM53039.1 ABC transporter permease [Salinirubellus salinus]
MSTTTPDSDTENAPLAARIRRNPRPALLWGVVFALLLAVQFGSLLTFLSVTTESIVGAVVRGVLTFLGQSSAAEAAGSGGAAAAGGGIVGQFAAETALDPIIEFARSLPNLLSRETIPNQGWQTGPGASAPWDGTFPTNLGFETGLSPAAAWALRTGLIVAYVFVFLYWLWYGYRTFVEHYRYADWTPRDDVVRRLRSHRWGQFGMVIVILFLTLAIFAPAVSPTTFEQNVTGAYNPDNSIKYFDEETGQVEEVLPANANLAAASTGPDQYTKPFSYDQFGRYHPFGTMQTPGQDLFTFMAYGARISLFVGLIAIAISSFLAALFGLLTAYYKGLIDLSVVMVSDTIQTIPAILLLILLSVVFADHWLTTIYDGGFLIAVILGFVYFPGLWRAVRGPAFQVSEQEWVDAARSYGQRSTQTMRKHMLPYILGYLLIYGSLTIGGVIITTAALSFLGIGITPPTPEWGRAVAGGRSYVTTNSGHIALIPGLLIVFVVTAFNAMGDGIRDAIDPQSEGGEGGAAEAAAAGGGG